MKSKALCVVFAALICILSVFSASADSNTFKLPELNDMSITLPDDVVAVTRSSTASDEYFSAKYGFVYDTTMNDLKNHDIYLRGTDTKSTYTLNVSMKEDNNSEEIGNYNLLDDSKLTQVQKNFLEEYSKESTEGKLTASKDSVDGIVWLYFSPTITSNGSTIMTYQANTVYNGKSITITIQRNKTDVTAQDFETLKSITNTVEFKTVDNTQIVRLVLIIAGVVLLIILIIFIAVSIRHIKHKKKKRTNNRIIEELADKYSKPRKNSAVEDGTGQEESEAALNVQEISDAFDEFDDEMVPKSKLAFEEEFEDISKTTDNDFLTDVEAYDAPESRKITRFSEDEINEILNDHSSKMAEREHFVYTLDRARADKIEAETASQHVDDIIQHPTEIEEESQPIAEEENEASVEAVPNTEEQTEPDEVQDEEASAEELEAFEEYTNDEDLVRDDAKHNKFNTGYDFFEEAPKKSVGVISSKEIEQAEDYDVIGEVEHQAEEVEKEEPKNSENASNASNASDFADKAKNVLGKIAAGAKSFFTHCGYFGKNVVRMIKHSIAKRKRKKAEEERRKRAQARAERQRIQRERAANGELVQVHSRTDRRPRTNGSKQAQSRPRPNGSKSAQNRPRPNGSKSAQSRPRPNASKSAQNRPRPTASRPAQSRTKSRPNDKRR